MTPFVALVVPLLVLLGSADSTLVQSQLREQLLAEDWVQYEDNFYKKSTSFKANWDGARALCKELHSLADLASIASYDEQDFLVNEFGNRFWIGLNDIDYEGYFKWANGDKVTFTNWSDYEPSNSDGGEDCAEVYPLENGKHVWNDAQCKDILPFICEVELP